ncbi:MAG: hypothetical protein Q8R15_02300 [Candidatus Micrarchaeota archaeon]|nr:hypothetical protein [Candidatus Micrarchaeota archaeon]
MHFPYDKALFKKHVWFYVAIQVVLWAKVTLFYFLYGQGILLRLIEPAYTLAPLLMPQVFTSGLLILDWLFHNLVHLALGVSIFLFARRVKKINLTELLLMILVADVLHNVGYWFTNSFTSLLSMGLDFVDDFVLMMLFFYLCYFLSKRYKWFNKLLPVNW